MSVRLIQRGFFLPLNTFCSSLCVAKFPAAPAAPRAADLANFLPATFVRVLPTFLPTIFNTGNRAPKNPAPLCLLLRPLLRTTLVILLVLGLVSNVFIPSSQSIQGLGHGPQEFEQKITTHLRSHGWTINGGATFVTFYAARSATYSNGSCFRHDVMRVPTGAVLFILSIDDCDVYDVQPPCEWTCGGRWDVDRLGVLRTPW